MCGCVCICVCVCERVLISGYHDQLDFVKLDLVLVCLRVLFTQLVTQPQSRTCPFTLLTPCRFQMEMSPFQGEQKAQQPSALIVSGDLNQGLTQRPC